MKNIIKAPKNNSFPGSPLRKVPVHIYGQKDPSGPKDSKLGYDGIDEGASQMPQHQDIKSLNEDHEYC